MEKSKTFISIFLVILIISIAVYEKHVDNERSEYNFQASASEECFATFCESALGVFDEKSTTFSDLQSSYTALMSSMKVWARNHYAHWQDKNLPYDITYGEEEGDDPLMDVYFAIPELYSDIVNACYLKEPEYEITLTKKQVEERVAELCSQMEIHCVPFS